MTMLTFSGMRLHYQIAWAWEAGVITLEEARVLARVAPWDGPETVDKDTAAVMRRYLWWLRATDTAQ